MSGARQVMGWWRRRRFAAELGQLGEDELVWLARWARWGARWPRRWWFVEAWGSASGTAHDTPFDTAHDPVWVIGGR